MSLGEREVNGINLCRTTRYTYRLRIMFCTGEVNAIYTRVTELNLSDVMREKQGVYAIVYSEFLSQYFTKLCIWTLDVVLAGLLPVSS